MFHMERKGMGKQEEGKAGGREKEREGTRERGWGRVEGRGKENADAHGDFTVLGCPSLRAPVGLPASTCQYTLHLHPYRSAGPIGGRSVAVAIERCQACSLARQGRRYRLGGGRAFSWGVAPVPSRRVIIIIIAVI